MVFSKPVGVDDGNIKRVVDDENPVTKVSDVGDNGVGDKFGNVRRVLLSLVAADADVLGFSIAVDVDGESVVVVVVVTGVTRDVTGKGEGAGAR